MVTANESDANVHDVSLVGGNTGLDFANTVYWRGRAQHVELINTYDDLVEWALRVGLMNPRQAERLKRLSLRQPEKAERARCRAIALRELMYRIFSTHADHLEVDEDDLDRLNSEWGRRMVNSRLIQDPKGFRWKLSRDEDALDWILTPILVACIELLTSKDVRRIKKCADGNCSWLFFDRSRNLSRRWCDMKDCGNRSKVKRFYKRRRTAAAT